MSSSNSSSSSIGFPGLLTLTFIVLKLTHVINWSWFWVLFPSILSILVFIIVMFVYSWFLDQFRK